MRPGRGIRTRHFYPRSPCGERHSARPGTHRPCAISIHALLAESDTKRPKRIPVKSIFLSTLSLRRATNEDRYGQQFWRFLSTLSLRRATPSKTRRLTNLIDFYPRSPCGERPSKTPRNWRKPHISIHALLAESDNCNFTQKRHPLTISIHALLAESDETTTGILILNPLISIHALLAESDSFYGLGREV